LFLYQPFFIALAYQKSMKESATIKKSIKFDFLFAGFPDANGLLILKLPSNDLLEGKSIGVLKPDSKITKDRTFCFWHTENEISKLTFKTFVSYSWDYFEIEGISKQQFKQLHFFHVMGIEEYNKTKNILDNHEVANFASILFERLGTISNHHEIILENETLHGSRVFDSLQLSQATPKKNQSHLFQSLYGCGIKTTTKLFDASVIETIDFNVPQNNFTQLRFVIPFKEDSVLEELTRFGYQKSASEDLHLMMNNYLKELGVSFEILELERGMIPISSAKMSIDNFGKNWVNVGVSAEIQKCATINAFSAMAEDALVQNEALKNDQLSKRNSKKEQFIFYNPFMLKIPDEKPECGNKNHETLFKKLPVTKVFSFLQKKTNVFAELSIFIKLPKSLFIKATVNDFLNRCISLPVLAWPFLFTIMTIVLSQNNYENISFSVLTLGFLSVGLSHGALDHLTANKIIHKKQLFYFVISYLLKSAIFGLVWLFLPDTAMLIFIAYSAWHFGQADFKEWDLPQGWQSFLWGLIVLGVILFFHFEELKWILQQIPNLECANILNKMSEIQLLSFQALIVVSGFCMAAFNKSKYILFTFIYLLLSSMLPLLVSFGIYFVGQHSIHGWRQLLIGLNERSSRLWLKSLPFSIGGACIIFYIPFFAGSNYFGTFFILLSCLSIPHVFSMHSFYSKLK